MKDLPVTVSSRGQIVIPKEVRDRLGIKEGTKLELAVQGQTIVLRRPGLVDWRSWAGKYRDAKLVEALEADHREEAERD